MERNLLSKRVITLEAAMEGSIDVDFFSHACVCNDGRLDIYLVWPQRS